MLFVKKPAKKPVATEAASLFVEPGFGATLDGESVRVADSPVTPPAQAAGSKDSGKSGFSFTRKRSGEVAEKAVEAQLYVDAEEVIPVPVSPDLSGRKPAAAQPAAAPAESSKASKLLGRFGKSSQKTASEPVTRPEAPKPAKAPKAPKAPKPAKPARAPKAPTRKSSALYIGMDVNETVTEWWAVSNGTLVALTEPPQGGRAVLFSKKDARLAATKTLSYNDAVGLGFQESGEDVTVVNASAQHRVVYATSPERIQGLGPEIIPGLLVLEAAASRGQVALPSIVGFSLPGENGMVAALVVGVLQQKGGLTRSQMTLNTSNPQFSIDQFVAQQKGFQQSSDVRLFGLQELLAEAAKLSSYPTEALVFGRIPKSKASLLSVALAAFAMAGSLGYYGYLATAMGLVHADIAEAQQAERTEKLKLADLVESRVSSLAAISSLDPVTLFESAREVRVPFSKVVLNATVSTGATMTVTFSPTGMRKGKASSFAASAEDIRAFNARETVGPCTRTTLSVNGVLNEIVATYTCKSATDAVPGYSLD
jgi:hypothetical protein